MKLGEVRATVLVENTSSRPDLGAEHGLALWLETPQSKVLFDTGATGLVCSNAEKLGIDLAQADAIVLSHDHYDHAGGLPAVAQKALRAKIYAHPAACIRVPGRQVVPSRRSTTVVPGVMTTGEVERVADFEAPCKPPLPFPDDQAVYFEVDEGVVVVVGCAHAGVVNTLKQVARLAKTNRIHAVLGGMHLLAASDERISKTVEAFRELRLQRIGPCHCTGDAAVSALEKEFPEGFFHCHTGTTITFGGQGG